jgi:hypothetical protein
MSSTPTTLYDMLTTFFTVFGALTSGIVLGFTLVSYMAYDKNDKYEEENDEDADQDEYCFKFFDELENLPERHLEKEELEELRLKTLEEETPEGKVIMSYNSDTESFWYYADSTIIPYSSLDAVARLYAITYNCKSICVNYKEEWEKGKERAIKEKELDIKRREEEEDKPKPKSIFANFKGYNKKHGSDDDNKKYYIMTERANTFKYKGKMTEFVNASTNAIVNDTETTNGSPIANAIVNGTETTNATTIINASPIANATTNTIDKKKIDYSTFKKIYIEKNI